MQAKTPSSSAGIVISDMLSCSGIRKLLGTFVDHDWSPQNADNAFFKLQVAQQCNDVIMQRICRPNIALYKSGVGWAVKINTRLNVYIANPGNFLGVFQRARGA